MQLVNKRRSNVCRALAAAAAGLLQSTQANAADTTTTFESGVLYYKESGGRVQAIEPSVTASYDFGNQHRLSLGVIYDSLTGASPNGAVPSTQSQNFVTPIKIGSTKTSVTSASGGSTIISIPLTPGQLAQAAFGRQYTVDAGKLPVDPGFKDQRIAANLDWSQPMFEGSTIGFGAGFSHEHDYQSLGAHTRLAQDFNDKNTTVSLALNYEHDTSRPLGGIPVPFTSMSPQWKGPNDGKNGVDAVLGVTQIMNRFWLTQFNYSYSWSNGYQNDPYRVISVVAPLTGLPVDNLYESRPEKRRRQSLYWDNRIHMDRDVLDLSLRYFWDDWGVHSITADISDRFSFARRWFIEPHGRFYHQDAASFYQRYLVQGQPRPANATSDTRLGTFNAYTGGLKLGWIPNKVDELALRVEYYKQVGNGHPPGAVGQLAKQDLFAQVSAVSATLSYSYGF